MAGLYIDTSALGRALLDEPEASAIRATLGAYTEPWSSELLATEFRRLAARESLLKKAEELLSPINLEPLDSDGLKRASSIEPVAVRTLDAIHLQTIVGLHRDGTIEAVMTDDRQLTDGYKHHGIKVVAPQPEDHPAPTASTHDEPPPDASE